jgi:UDP-glucose 4-epimerase
MKVFVTGGAGFIGSHTVDLLQAEGHAVRVFDDLSTGTLANLAHHGDVVWGDVLDAEALAAAMAGCDAVLHLAALVSVPDSIARPERAHAINATGTLNVLEAARRNGIRRVVMASSAAVYGANQRLPLRGTRPRSRSRPTPCRSGRTRPTRAATRTCTAWSPSASATSTSSARARTRPRPIPAC